MRHKPDVFKALKEAKEKILQVPEVLSVDAHIEVILHVTTNLFTGDKEVRNKVYEIEKQLLEKFPDVNFDFNVRHQGQY